MRVIVLLLLALVVAGCDKQNPAAPQDESALQESGVGLDRSHAGEAAPATPFTDSKGQRHTLADFRGRPVLVNLWASWCAPCVKELPTLDAVASAKSAPRVLAISQDMAPLASVNAFWKDRKLKRLVAYHDDEMALSGALGAQILPTSVLYDSNGREVWRYVGDRDWADNESLALLAEGKRGAPPPPAPSPPPADNAADGEAGNAG